VLAESLACGEPRRSLHPSGQLKAGHRYPGQVGPGRTTLLACGGMAGPVAFTAAWVASSLRQTGYAAARVQLSGLAALDARDPQIMMAGFIALGLGSIAFGTALGHVLPAAPGPWLVNAGPWLIKAGGVAAVAAGLFRRDHMLLAGPGFAGESWHNQAHDVVSDVAYAAMIAVPAVLARRFRGDPGWAGLRPPRQGLAVLSAAALALFASRAVEPWNGTVQRVAVTLPLAAEILVAARLAVRFRAGRARHRPGPADPAGRAVRPGARCSGALRRRRPPGCGSPRSGGAGPGR
jgi:hypothetical protein